ncbi:MAG TPA: serine/threonine-protein kinase [Kofleriaceae bacterium]|nr:serine/threonine-protein kinase [Kofleriaceae bacterium]
MFSRAPTERSDAAAPDSAAENEPPAGGSVGRFRVHGMLGRGGMGIVLDAFDPQLDRPVAVKLLRPDVWGTTTQTEQARLRREAQAMARLSHPNVVTVYDVGEVDGQSFLAMEKVDGTTLRAWQQQPRTPAAIIAMYLTVGRGLAAAHAAKLVHRDFKPENVLVGRDGRARVSDFGLVSSGTAVVEADLRDTPLGTRMTVAGSAMGTPAYMAPEQWDGEDVDARADQFSYAVALWEAVYGEHPFATTGATAASLRAAVLTGTPRSPSRTVKAPSWLRPILERALARDRADRWPTLDAMLDELARRSAPSRLPLVIGGGTVVAAAAAVAFVVTTQGATRADPCPTPALAGTWDASTRDRVRAHLVGLDAVRGESMFAEIARHADRQAHEWQAMHVTTCRDTRAGRQSDTLHDQRIACLSDRIDELRDTADITLATREPGRLESVLSAWGELSSVDDCADRATVAGFVAPPAPGSQAEASAIADELRAIEVARRAGQLEGLDPRASAALARARALAHPPLLAVALQRVALVATDRNDTPTAQAALLEATEIAARAGNDDIAADAWTRLLKVVAFDGGKPDEALVLVPAARAAVARAGDRLPDRVALLDHESDVYLKLKRYPDALAKLTEARGMLESAGAANLGSPLETKLADVLMSLGVVHNQAGSYDLAIPLFEEAIAHFDKALGPDHPASAFAFINLGETLRRLDRKEDAQRAFETAVRIRETRLGESPALAHALGALGNIARERQDLVRALELMERSARIARATMPDSNLYKLAALVGLSTIYLQLQRDDEARAVLDEAIAIGDRSGARNSNRANALINRGDLDTKVGDCVSALPRYERANAQFEELGGKDAPGVLMSFRRVAHCRIALRDYDGALAALERVLASPAPPPSLAIDIILARHLHGYALEASRRDIGRGKTLQREARLQAESHGAAAVAQVERVIKWFARYAPAP